MPIRLLAFADDNLAGTITLRQRAMSDLPEFAPGLGGLYVPPRYRRQGIGAKLVKAGMDLAQKQRYTAVFATTISAQGILERLAWQKIKTITHDGEQLGLYKYKFQS